QRDKAGLHPHSTLEPEAGDSQPVVICPQLGSSVRGADSRAQDRGLSQPDTGGTWSMDDIARHADLADLRETDAAVDLSADKTGRALHEFIADMYPISRSITGDGTRRTIDLIRNYVPLTTCEVPSGLQVFDWTVPPEWNVRDAYVKNSAGERVIDFRKSNLHLLGYSIPVSAHMTLDELKPHLYSDPEKPDWIPYRTSYYQKTWGF